MVLPRRVYGEVEEAVFVLHCFQKKSKSGIATPKQDIDIVRATQQLIEELRHEKASR